MKHLCRELERHIESGVEHLPSALESHVAGCARCQRAWRLQRAYQRALHAARRAPMPACEVPWTRIQAQLAARAVRRQPLAWLRPALAWGTAVTVVLAVGATLLLVGMPPTQQDESLVRAPAHTQPESARAQSAPANTSAPVATEPTPPQVRVIALAIPRLRESARLQPPAPTTPRTNPGVPRRRLADRATPPALAESARLSASRLNYEPSDTVASLPLTPIGVSDSSAGVEYLPISYGSSSSYREGSNDEAIIGSF